MSASTPTGLDTAKGAAAFSSNFQRAGASLWCVAAGVLGSREEAEDCLQEAAMIAWSKWSEFESGTHFGAWMSRIVRYTALNRSRRRERRRALPLASTYEPVDRSAPEDSRNLDATAALTRASEMFDDRVVSALNQLKEEARSCLLLKVVGELGYAEISELMEIPEGTAMSHVSRARVRLRELLAGAEELQ